MKETCQRCPAEFNAAELYQGNAKILSGWVFGLCLPCTKADIHMKDCSHLEALRERTPEIDPLMSDTTDTDDTCVVS